MNAHTDPCAPKLIVTPLYGYGLVAAALMADQEPTGDAG
jgi:hypothetical protein